MQKSCQKTVDLKQLLIGIVHLIMFLTLLMILWGVGIVIHEIGHGLLVEAFGGDTEAIYIYPGLEIYPHPGQPYPDPPYAYFGNIRYDRTSHFSDIQWGWVGLMGSGATLLVAFTGHTLLWSTRPRKRLPRYSLISLSLFYLDMVTYVFSPQLGLPRMVIVGTPMNPTSAEPLQGANALGVPTPFFNLFNLLLLVVLTTSLILYMRFHFTRNVNDPN